MLNYSFPLKIEDNDLKIFKAVYKEKKEKKLSDIKNLLLNSGDLNFDCVLYKFYRNVSLKEDLSLFSEHHIRHDISILFPGTLNGEFLKTHGHYHPKIKNKTYPEIYQVINGEGLFLLQDGPDIVKDVRFVFAKEGEIVVIPPSFGHVTINFSKENLIWSNLIADTFESDYEPFKNKKGGVYYILEDNPLKWVPNMNYKNIKQPEFFIPKQLFDKKPLYDIFKENPSFFDWLLEPIRFPYHIEDLFENKEWGEIKLNL
jgi:glucose-6-phosphate isomerase